MNNHNILNLGFAVGMMLSLGAVSPSPLPAQGTLEPLLQYQGVLRDADGALINGEVEITFNLFKADDLDPSSAVWKESHELTLTDGLVSTVLGQTTTLDPELFHGETMWLGIEVDDDGILSPMQPLLPSAQAVYAYTAGNAEQLQGNSPYDFVRTEGPTSISANVRAPVLTVEQIDDAGVALKVEGQLVASSIHYDEPRTRQYWVSPMEFSPARSITEYVAASGGLGGVYALDHNVNSFVQSFSAPVRLPAGAVVTGFRAYMEDHTDEDHLEVTLRRSNPGVNFFTILASVSSTELNGDDWVETSDIEGGGTFNPETQVLWVFARADTWNWAASGDALRVHGARITYTMEEIP